MGTKVICEEIQNGQCKIEKISRTIRCGHWKPHDKTQLGCALGSCTTMHKETKCIPIQTEWDD